MRLSFGRSACQRRTARVPMSLSPSCCASSVVSSARPGILHDQRCGEVVFGGGRELFAFPRDLSQQQMGVEIDARRLRRCDRTCPTEGCAKHQ